MLGLRTVVYKVTDLANAKEWYTKAFKTKPYFDEAFYVGFNIGGYELGLLPESDKEDVIKSDNAIAYWGVDDLSATLKKLLDIGAVKHDEPMDVGEGVIVASVKDPWNNIIGIIYNPYFKIEG